MSFNWKQFVIDVEVVCNDFKVKHLCYNDIQIHQCSEGSLLVGAYKFSKESNKDKELINLFQNHGVVICTIIRAINHGLSPDEKDTFESFMVPCYYKDKEVLQLAYQKGLALQEEVRAHIANQKREQKEEAF